MKSKRFFAILTLVLETKSVFNVEVKYGRNKRQNYD